MTSAQHIQKRVFDLAFSLICILISTVPLILVWIVASIDTRSNGLFTQIRLGKNAQPFLIYKVKTIRSDESISAIGRFFRKSKLDESPQFLNILLGDMSVVGPRPDVPGFLDKLQGDDRIVWSVRPGITGPATLSYRDEERLLASIDDPVEYNKTVIYPDKVAINKEYICNYSFIKDIKIIVKTIVG